jgi:hypothetical protein
MRDNNSDPRYTATYLQNHGKANRVQVRRDGDPVLTIPEDMADAIRVAMSLMGGDVGEAGGVEQ